MFNKLTFCKSLQIINHYLSGVKRADDVDARLLAGRGTLNNEHCLQEPQIMSCSHVASNYFPKEKYTPMSRPIISPKRNMLTCRVRLFPRRDIYSHVASNYFPRRDICSLLTCRFQLFP